MKPSILKTKIFLDSGDPEETKEIINLLGFLDGQTTNPTLISKNPFAREQFEKGEKFSSQEILDFYQKVVKEISGLIPNGSVSIEVYADSSTSFEEMLKQGKEMFSWIPNAHIKYPITKQGLKAAEASTKDGLRMNMTLCFTQEQAAAVYAATSGANPPSLLPSLKLRQARKLRPSADEVAFGRRSRRARKGDVFVSPFVGRLDDKKENGMDLIKNIIEMYKKGDGHAEVLTASVRNINHFLYALQLGSDIITAPFGILKEWGEKDMPLPDNNFIYEASSLKPIPYQEIDLDKNWQEFNLKHELTDKGIEQFSNDWNELIGPTPSF